MNTSRFARRSFRHQLPLLLLLLTLSSVHKARADSMTVSETWNETATNQATDNGTFSASLTVSNLQNLNATTWSNTLIILQTGNLNTGAFFDLMGSANPTGGIYGPGSAFTATTATFYIQELDANNDPVNAFRLTFSRSGNTLTISGQTISAPTLSFPWSIAAANYLYDATDPTNFTPKVVNDPNPCEVTVESADQTVTYADITRTMLINETDTTNSDAFGDILNHSTVSGAADFTPPTQTAVSPTASLTVTNGLLPVIVKATDASGVANVEFYLNSQDFGPGIAGVSNLWSQNLALLPGINTIQTVAMDNQSNVSTNTLTVTYANGQTNANAIVFAEHWLDSYATNSGGASAITQDAGVLDVAVAVPGLQTMTADTWSNLVVVLNFGNFQLASKLVSANSLTTNTAFFQLLTATNATGNVATVRQATVTRSGQKLLVAADSINPTYAPAAAFATSNYYANASAAISDQQPCSLTLLDGHTLSPYLVLDRNIYITGTNAVTISNSVTLDNIQISGAADFTPPALTDVSPAALTLTTTNGLLNVAVRATDAYGVTNVEFYVNGEDFGTGGNGASNIWFQNVALIPGTNTIQAVAADPSGNQSAVNFTVNYVNTQTNANEIVFSEHWQDGYITNSGGAYSFSQDAGVVDAAFTIPALQSMTSDTWSNLILSLSFGQLPPPTGLPGGGFGVYPPFGGISLNGLSLGTANILTTNSATFQLFTTNALNNPVLVEQVTIKRVGTNLLLAAELLNPSYNSPPTNFFSALYYGLAGAINDQQPFIFALTDGNNSTQYANIYRPIYIHGTNSITTTNSISLNNIQITGVADFVPPTLTNVFPATTTFTTTNGLLTVQVAAADNIAVSNVEFYVAGQDFGPGNNISNQWSQNLALNPGTNIIGAVALDSSGNISISNVVKVNYINTQTNANLITFSEHLQEYKTVFVFSPGGPETFAQDAAILDAALSIPPIKNITADTWSNLNLSISFDGLQLNSSLSSATALTTNSATFDVLNNTEQVIVTQIGGTLLVAAKTSTPNYSLPLIPFVAGDYVGVGGTIDDQKSFTLTLTNGITSEQYADISRTIYISGSNFFTNLLNNVQISGTADFTPPTNQITAPIAGQQWSNNTFVVTGKAQDDRAVSNVVYSLNGSDWAPVNSGNAFTNWTIPVNLNVGSNTFSTYAYDYDNNYSVTSSVIFRYIPSSTIALSTNGLGTLSPNYAGALLGISNTYSITATPASGFIFSNWTGSLNVKTATLTFQMQSNLSFTANFIDVTRPTISITNLIANQQLSNSAFTVRGNAADNWQVTNVVYQLNLGGWSNAMTGNYWTNWNAPLTLIPGTNTLQVYAQDEGGNHSLTNTLSFVYVLSSRLQIQLAGLGTLSPNYSNSLLAIGQNYTITATPATGFVFTNWVVSTNFIGGRTVTTASLPFTMASNLTLLADFVDVTRPLLTITAPTANQRMTNALASVVGTASDNWKVAGVWYQFNTAPWITAPTTNGWTNWNTTLTLPAGTNSLSAYALDLGGNYSLTSSVSFFSSNTFQLQFVFVTNTPLAANGLNFDLLVSTNLRGHVQYSTNLLNWITLTNFNGTNSTLKFTDPSATNGPVRFYRAVIP